MERHSGEPSVRSADDHTGVDLVPERNHAVAPTNPVTWPFPANWRNVKPQSKRERLEAMEDALW